MQIIERLLTILTPYECLGCGTEGDLVCGACIQQLTTFPDRCYRCLGSSPGGLTCSDCMLVSRLVRVRAAALYTGLAKELVARLKFDGAQSAALQMASCLADQLGGDYLIVPVPTATGRVRGRGYDQARLVAKALSRQTRLPYADCLARSGQTHQVGASRERRRHQLRTALRVKNPRPVRGRRVLLVDDVVTTGATLETAASVLERAGASRIEAVVFCAA